MSAEKRKENMLVKSEDLDQLLMLAGEVIISSSNQGILNKLLQNLHSAQKSINKEVIDTSKDLDTMTTLLSSELHHLIQSIRTVDLKDLGFRAKRLVRDVSRRTGKPVDFKFIGDETAVDKSIIEKLYDPVSHQLRNAVDHGIENINERRKKGKSEEGVLTLTAYNTEQETFIEIKDDGAGIDMDHLKQKGLELGIITEKEKFLAEHALEVMCAPGVTTADTISELSGRGVGMDVVKNHIDSLGGSISLESEKDKGTTFTFRIPLLSAVNIIDALVVKTEESTFAFPISNVVASMSLSKEDITSPLNKGRMLKYLGQLLPLFSLEGVIFKKEPLEDDFNQEMIPVLIIEHKSRKIALTVSEFLSPQKLVIIPFDSSFSIQGLVGTTILGGRHLGFIIDIPSFVDLAFDKTEKKVLNMQLEDNSQAIDKLKPADHDKTAFSEINSGEMNQDKTKEVKAGDFDDTAILESSYQEFIIELEKLMPDLNEYTFKLESDPENSDNINASFRLLHTIKGNLIMMGLPKAGETIHSVESVLDRLRESGKKITPEVMDIIMDGVTYIQNIIQSSGNKMFDDIADEDIINRSKAFFPEKEQPQIITDILSDEVELTHEASYRIHKLRKAKNRFYKIYIEFEPGGQPAFLLACLMYKRLFEVGEVLGSLPDLKKIETGLVEKQLKILFASEWEIEKLENNLVPLFKEYYGAVNVILENIRL